MVNSKKCYCIRLIDLKHPAYYITMFLNSISYCFVPRPTLVIRHYILYTLVEKCLFDKWKLLKKLFFNHLVLIRVKNILRTMCVIYGLYIAQLQLLCSLFDLENLVVFLCKLLLNLDLKLSSSTGRTIPLSFILHSGFVFRTPVYRQVFTVSMIHKRVFKTPPYSGTILVIYGLN